MEGRRSRSKPHEQGKLDNINNISIVKFSPSPQAAKSSSAAGRMAVTHQVEAIQAAVAVDDRFVPKISGENKRKRAPRGPPGRNFKAKATMGSEHEYEHEEAKPNSLPIVEHHQQTSASHSEGEFQVPLHGDDEDGRHMEDDNHHTGFDNGEVLYENGDEGSNAKDLGEKRRGSSRLRIRPSKFRESFPTSSAKVKLELKNGEDPARALEIVLPINSIISPVVRAKEDLQTVATSPQAVQEPPHDVPVVHPTKKKESKTKSSMPAAVKDKGPSTSAPVALESSEAAGLKAILLVLKRVMKMEESDPFNKPVNPVELGIPDYFKVVKRPMDLGTIRDRLEKGEVYKKVEQVLEDVALVWSNCRLYNDDGDPIMELLQSVESSFNKHCQAAGFPVPLADGAEVHIDKPEGDHEKKEEQPKTSKKKSKGARSDAGALLKTKIKRSAPVDQVMAESKAREQKVIFEGVNLGDQDRDVKNAVEHSGMVDKPLEISHNEYEHGQGNPESHNDDPANSQGPVEIKPQPVEEESTPEKHQRKAANVQHVILPNKTKRPNGHSTLSHRQGCLCVVCVGRRKREAKLRKSGGGTNSILSKSIKKVMKPSMMDSEDGADRVTNGDGDVEDDLTYTDNGEDGTTSPDNVQGYYSASYQLPLRKLDSSVVEMSRVLLGSKPGSVWNRPHSLGYVPVPFKGRRVGLMEAIANLSKIQ